MAVNKLKKLLPKKHKKVLKVKRIPESKIGSQKRHILKQSKISESEFSEKSAKTSSLQEIKSLSKHVVIKAIKALKSIHQNHQENENAKKNILSDPENSTIFLQVTMEKIPRAKLRKMIRVKLPHSLLEDSSEVCLIIGDSDKANRRAPVEDDVLKFKTILSDLGITQITEVVSLRQLRTEYKMFEARRKLLGAYDTFLADERIIATLPRALGRSFFKKRKFPLGVCLKTNNLKERIESTLSKAVFNLTCTGNTCSSTVARVSMKNREIFKNISECVNSLVKNIPGSWGNISKLNIKTALSMSIPVYMAYLDPNEVRIPVTKKKRSGIVEEELSTLPDASVKVLPDLSVIVRQNEIEEDSELSDPDHKKIPKGVKPGLITKEEKTQGKLKKKSTGDDKSGEELEKVDEDQSQDDNDQDSFEVEKTPKKASLPQDKQKRSSRKTKKKLPKLLKEVLESEDDDDDDEFDGLDDDLNEKDDDESEIEETPRMVSSKKAKISKNDILQDSEDEDGPDESKISDDDSSPSVEESDESEDVKIPQMKTSSKAKLFQGHEAEAFRNKFNEVYGSKKGDSNRGQKRKAEESKSANRKIKKSEAFISKKQIPESFHEEDKFVINKIGTTNKISAKGDRKNKKQVFSKKKGKKESKFVVSEEMPDAKQQLHMKKSKNVNKSVMKTKIPDVNQELSAEKGIKNKSSAKELEMAYPKQEFHAKKKKDANKLAVKGETADVKPTLHSKKMKSAKFTSNRSMNVEKQTFKGKELKKKDSKFAAKSGVKQKLKKNVV